MSALFQVPLVRADTSLVIFQKYQNMPIEPFCVGSGVTDTRYKDSHTRKRKVFGVTQFEKSKPAYSFAVESFTTSQGRMHGFIKNFRHNLHYRLDKAY